MAKQTAGDGDFAHVRRVRDRGLMHAARRRVRPVLAPKFGTPLVAAVPVAGAMGAARNGGGADVLLQGFHWESHNSQNPNWYTILAQNAGVIQAGLFDVVWFPPASQSADAEGYMPTRWSVFDSSYGTMAELKGAIQALKPVRGLADVVINHRCGVATAGTDFDSPAFADQNGAVTKDDECGTGTGNYDTGERNSYARDLDHTAAEVQTEIVKYMKLLQGLAFSAWRYDEARGYGGQYAGKYNDATLPYLSVGEVWTDDRQEVMNWIDATGGRSMAFDFPTRTLLKTAVNQRLFSQLKTIDGKPTGAIGWWPAMSVTFVEDHDTASDGTGNQPFGDGDHVLQGYAYILTHPGTPCVFWTHYFDWGAAIQGTIRELIAVRKKSGITSTSVVSIVAADDHDKYAAIVDGKVAVKLGPGAWDPGAGWSVAVSGNDFAVWTVNA